MDSELLHQLIFFHTKQKTFKSSLWKCTLDIMPFSATLDSYSVCFNIKDVWSLYISNIEIKIPWQHSLS